MANRQTFTAGVLREQISNGTQPGDPATGYTAWNAQGGITTQRALNAQETAGLVAMDAGITAGTNQATLQGKAQQALTANATFQAIGSPSNAQVAAQVQALTKQSNGVIRLLLNALDSTAGT